MIDDAIDELTAEIGAPPWQQQPWRRLLAENTPGRAPTPAPIMIAQGLADPLVLPSVQRQFVQGLCDIDQTVDYREYDGVGHLDAGAATAQDVARWLAERFDGTPARSTCWPVPTTCRVAFRHG